MSGIITVSYTERQAERITLIFDESEIICKRGESHESLSSGAQVLEGERLNFEAKNLSAGKTVDVWTAGNKTYTEFSFYYEVNKQDVVSGNITVSYTVRPIELLTIEFDNTAITCKTIPDNKPVATGSKQPEGTTLELATVSGKSVRWQIGRYRYSATSRVRVPLHKSRINQGAVLKVSYEE